MSIDLKAGLRRVKPDKHVSALRPRALETLVRASAVAGRGRAALVPDTNVYIRSAAGTLPDDAATLADDGLLFHCSVCVAELTTGVANADPKGAGWKRIRDHYVGLIGSILPTRLLTPDAQSWSEAGLIAGTLARTQGYSGHQRKECLNDALIFLTATKAGLPVLTGDRRHFDLIQQLAPQGRFICF